MSGKDRQRWDEKWAAVEGPFRPHPLLLEHSAYLKGGDALDLACGQGQNAIWLAGRGYHVLGVDISLVALQTAQQEAAAAGVLDRVHFVAVDLDDWAVPVASFDLVVIFRFLDRRLFGPIREGVRPGGLVYYSTRHLGTLVRHPEASVSYLLQPGELAAAFWDWRILHRKEGPENAELIAQKIDARR